MACGNVGPQLTDCLFLLCSVGHQPWWSAFTWCPLSYMSTMQPTCCFQCQNATGTIVKTARLATFTFQGNVKNGINKKFTNKSLFHFHIPQMKPSHKRRVKITLKDSIVWLRIIITIIYFLFFLWHLKIILNLKFRKHNLIVILELLSLGATAICPTRGQPPEIIYIINITSQDRGRTVRAPACVSLWYVPVTTSTISKRMSKHLQKKKKQQQQHNNLTFTDARVCGQECEKCGRAALRYGGGTNFTRSVRRVHRRRILVLN